MAVVSDGKIVLLKGYGLADVASRRPIDPERTTFRVGSLSKLFTWTAAMQLVEEGRLDLDRDINDYIDFKIPERFGKPITLRDLMTHTADVVKADVALLAFGAGATCQTTPSTDGGNLIAKAKSLSAGGGLTMR